MNGKVVSVLTEGLTIKEFVITEEEKHQPQFHIGDIVIGRISNIVKNINSIFVEIYPGIEGYLSYKEGMELRYVNRKTSEKPAVCDLILVQIAKEPTKTKSYSLTTDFTIMSHLAVLKSNMTKVHFSSKLKGLDDYKAIKSKFTRVGKPFLEQTGIGFIVRKSSAFVEAEEFEKSLYHLYSKYQTILTRGMYGVKYEKIFKEIPANVNLIRDNYDVIEKIMTDDSETYKEYSDYLQEAGGTKSDILKFYEDDKMSLTNLYSIKSTLENCLSKKVWLKSGAYIIIEYTEAMTIIDVNSGKATAGKKTKKDTFFNINLEAAEEIAKQIKLRNLSGIIIIDFIEIPKEYYKTLINSMSQFLKEESTNAQVVDITGLGLMEITRRRTGKPLHESISVHS